MRIWKYRLHTMDGFSAVYPGAISMPMGARIIHVAMQGRDLCLWAIVDAEMDPQRREFIIVGTGHEVRSDAAHVGSVLDGPFVWHLFEILA